MDTERSNVTPDPDLPAKTTDPRAAAEALEAEVEDDFEPEELKRYAGDAEPASGSGPLP